MGSGAAKSVIISDSRVVSWVRVPVVPLWPTVRIGLDTHGKQFLHAIALERDVAVFLGWQGLPLGAQGTQRAGDREPGLGGPDDRVYVAALGRDVRVGQGVLVLGDPLGAQRVGVPGDGELAPVQDVHRPLRA